MQLTQQQIKAELWKRGELSYKLHTAQKELYDLYRNSKEKTNVWLLGRRSGKTFCLVVLAIEECLRTPNSIVKLVSPTKVQVEQNVRPLFRKILEDCPSFLEPKENSKNNTYRFKNGSEIQLAGTDAGHAERLRGSDCTAAFVDEAGSCADLSNLVRDILLPATLATRGKIVLASTPPKDGDHDFIRFIEEAEIKQTIVKKPTTCNPLISPDELALLIQELGGEESDVTQREIYCRLIKDPTKTVVPEFDDILAEKVVKDVIRPPFFDTYESMDIGFTDLTGVLFAYYDFKSAKLVIEDELLINFQKSDVTLPKLIELIQQKEKDLWFIRVTGEVKPVSLRVSDINPIVTQEIQRASNYQLNFVNAQKDDKEAAVNQLRVMISSKRIIISPKCKNLVAQLKHGKWKVKGNKRELSRSTDNGHYDLLDALIYLVRSVNYSKNPYPSHYNMSPKDLFVLREPINTATSSNVNVFKALFSPKGKPHG